MCVFYYLGLNTIAIVTLVYKLPYGNIEWSVSLFDTLTTKFNHRDSQQNLTNLNLTTKFKSHY